MFKKTCKKRGFCRTKVIDIFQQSVVIVSAKKKGEDHNCRKMTITKTAPYDVKCRFEKEAISHQNI